MASHRSYVSAPPCFVTRRPLRRTIELVAIEWLPVIATLALVLVILGMAYQLAS